MNLRNIPQKENFIQQNDKQQNFMLESESESESKTISKSKKIVVSEWKNSSIRPDCIFGSENKKINDNTFDLINNYTLIKHIDKEYTIIKLNELFDKFEKKEVSTTLISHYKIDLGLIQLDWINTFSIEILDKLNNTCVIVGDGDVSSNYPTNLTEPVCSYMSLPIGTTISLIIGSDEIMLHTINDNIHKQFKENKNEKLLLNFPNNFLYQFTRILLQINLPENFNKESYENLTNNFEFKFEFDGWTITNKNIISNLENKIIEFDNNKLYSNLNLGIYNSQLKMQIKNFYNLENHNHDHDHNHHFSNIQMSYLMGYLKKPFEKKFIMNNILCLHHLDIFDYFNWIKIKTFDENKLCVGTIIELEMGQNIVLVSKICKDTLFDNENYYKFEIDFPNVILYKYHEIKLKITLPNKNDNDDDNDDNDDDNNFHKYNSFKIIIKGSTFKVSTPKMFSSLNTSIIYNHNSKWYIPGEKEFVSMSGMVCNRYCIMSKEVAKDNDIAVLFEKLHKKNLITINKIKLDC
jgi:hypothetical protein